MTTLIRRLLVQGPSGTSAEQLKEDERALLEGEGWKLGKLSHDRFDEVRARSPDGELRADFVAAHYPKYARASGYKYTWTTETRELRRQGIPTLFVFLVPAESY